MPPSLLRAADALLLGVAIVWGTTFPLGKLLGTVAALALAASTLEPRPGPLPPHVVGAIVFMAVAAILLAYLAQTWAQRFTSPVRTGLLFAVEPLAAVAFGVLWLGDSLSARQAVARPRSWAGWSWAK